MRAFVFLSLFLSPLSAIAAEIVLSPGDDIQEALENAMPGDFVVLQAGEYTQAFETVRGGMARALITVRGEGDVVIRTSGRVVDVQHPYFALDNITIDGDYGDRDAIRVGDDGDFFELRNSEVMRSGRDCVDMGEVDGVQILDSSIHHCLNWDGERVDAHGVTGSSVTNLVIRNTEIHSFTGDAIQFDPGRSEPGWNNIEISNCAFWLAPLPQEENGVPAGTVPGENAIDTKTNENAPTARMTITNTIAYGFRGGLISNMAAYNIKENVYATFDGVRVWDSEIAFRLRGATGSVPNGSRTEIFNAVIYDVDKVVRYEDDLQFPIVMYHSTFGRNVEQAFQNASAPDDVLDIRNLVTLDELPDEASGGGNVRATSADFVDANADDYRPTETASFLDIGEELMVEFDLRGVPRPFGDGVDSGAYEFTTEPIEPRPTPGNNATGNNEPGNNQPGNNGQTPNNDNSPGNESAEESGCCRTTGRSADALWLLVGLGVLGLRRRKLGV